MNEWKEIPCKCGFTDEENPEQFENYDLPICTRVINGYTDKITDKITVPRCKTCKTISVMGRDSLDDE